VLVPQIQVSTVRESDRAVELAGDQRSQTELLELAEVKVRIILSLLLTPLQFIALGDDDAACGFARRYLVPPLLGLTT
jgi:hypothetical protein